MRATAQIVQVNEKDISLAKIIAAESVVPEEMIAATVILEDQIAALKNLNDHVKQMLRATRYEDIVDNLSARSLIDDKEGKIAVEITTKLGDVVTATVYKDIDTCFEVSKDMSDKDVLSTVVPDKYKKVSVLLDKKRLEEDFDAGTLPDTLKGYCSKSPVEITKIRKTTPKKGVKKE